MKQEYTLVIDAPLFKTQRKLLTELICDAHGPTEISQETFDMLCGLENLCDEIADQAFERYGLDTLFLGVE